MTSPTMVSNIKELREIIDSFVLCMLGPRLPVDAPLRSSFQNMHGGYPEATLGRFLKARDDDLTKAGRMILDCLNWRVNNNIDNILAEPILPKEKHDAIRQSQLIGFCGYCKKGRPVFAIGVGNTSFDQASVDQYVQSHVQINEYRDRIILPEISLKKGRHVGSCVKILDMTGLRLSVFSRLKISTAIATVDDLNYPEKTDTYYIVNAPYVFSACWKAVKPMLQERTKRKVKVLSGNGQDELLQVMDYDTLPSFCKTNYGSFDNDPKSDVFSPNHEFHVGLYEYMRHKALSSSVTINSLSSEGSLHFKVPTLDEQDQRSETCDVIHAIEAVLPTLEAAQNSSDENHKDKLTTNVAGIQEEVMTRMVLAPHVRGLMANLSDWP